MTARVAVIGAGISGLACAQALQKHGTAVTVFEKSRGVGGRMSTRRTDEQVDFDHGAQYFTVRDARFRQFIESCLACGIVEQWDARIATLAPGVCEFRGDDTPRLVGIPAMNAVCRRLAKDVETVVNTRVGSLARRDNLWLLRDSNGEHLGAFDWVVCTAPPQQTYDLLASHSPIADAALRATMKGCWALMLAFDEPLGLPFDAAFVEDSTLSWIACNSCKPRRTSSLTAWVLHASAEWTETHFNTERQQVKRALLESFWRVSGATERPAQFIEVHRWRYALPVEPLETRCLADMKNHLAGCGDWCGGPRVEGAFLSGAATADQVLKAL